MILLPNITSEYFGFIPNITSEYFGLGVGVRSWGELGFGMKGWGWDQGWGHGFIIIDK